MRSAADIADKYKYEYQTDANYITATSISNDPKDNYWGQKLGIQFAKEGVATGKELLSNPQKSSTLIFTGLTH